MSENYTGECTCRVNSDEGGKAVTRSVADWLSLAAAPTFAMMALLTSVLGGDSSDVLCSPPHHGSPLTGMVAMYLLMSAFHVAPWLKLITSRRSDAQRAVNFAN